MLKSPEPKLGQNPEELDGGWEEPVAPTSVPPRSNSVSSAPVPATDELDDAWGSEPLVAAKPVVVAAKPVVAVSPAARPLAEKSNQAAPVVAKPVVQVSSSTAKPGSIPPVVPRAVAAPSEPRSGVLPLASRPAATPAAPRSATSGTTSVAERTAASGPAPIPERGVASGTAPVPAPSSAHATATGTATVSAPTPGLRAPSGNVGIQPRRALSKKERRELERQQRAHATRKGSERKKGRSAKRREEALRRAEEKQKQRAAERAAAESEPRQAPKRTPEKSREKRVESRDVADPTVRASGTKRKGAPAGRNKGRPQKYSGGGLILAIIALVTLATGIYAWSKR